MDQGEIYRLKMDLAQVERFQSLFLERSGLLFEGRRIREMEQAVARRMIELGHSGFDEYFQRLAHPRAGREELNLLVVSLTVGETQFYRTPDQFAVLRKYVLPELIEKERKREKRLRIISAGCATGEEAYTLSILLHELIPDLADWKVLILACDINQEFLDKARSGLYSERKLRLVDPNTLSHYFDRKSKNLWRVKDFLRRPIEWEHFNLNSDDYPGLAGRGLFHLALCRNVFIYFDLANIRRAVDKFYEIILPGGYFMLGYSETLFKISDRFQSVHTPEAFFYQRTEKPLRALPELPPKHQPYEREEILDALGSRPHPWVELARTPGRELPAPAFPAADGPQSWTQAAEPSALAKTAAPAPPGLPGRPEPVATGPERPVDFSARTAAEATGPAREPEEETLWEEALDLFAAEKFEEARRQFERMIQLNPRSARAHLGLGFLYANLGAEDRSREHAEKARGYNDLLPEIYFLLALLDEKNSAFERALENYQRVILLFPDFAMAHFNLGNLFLKLHRHRDARREFKNTLAILERDRENCSLRFSGGLSREAVMAFCRIQADQTLKAVPHSAKAR